MNSEFLKEQQLKEGVLADEQMQKTEKTENEIIVQGRSAQDFTEHPFWQVFERDLKQLRELLIKQLLTCKGLRIDIMNLQNEIKLIDIFLSMPEKYIDRLKSLLLRKKRERG